MCNIESKAKNVREAFSRPLPICLESTLVSAITNRKWRDSPRQRRRGRSFYLPYATTRLNGNRSFFRQLQTCFFSLFIIEKWRDFFSRNFTWGTCYYLTNLYVYICPFLKIFNGVFRNLFHFKEFRVYYIYYKYLSLMINHMKILKLSVRLRLICCDETVRKS